MVDLVLAGCAGRLDPVIAIDIYWLGRAVKDKDRQDSQTASQSSERGGKRVKFP